MEKLQKGDNMITIKQQKYDFRKERDEYYLHELKAGGQLEVKEKCTIPIQMSQK